LWERDEGSEVWEQVAGLVEANAGGELDILVTNCLTVYRPQMDGRRMRLDPAGTIAATWCRGTDVVHIHHLLPILRHLVVGALFRLRGATVVFSPMAFLTRDFAQRSWTHRRPRLWSSLKTSSPRALRSAWNAVAHAYICQSEYEVRSSRLPRAKCIVLHWPKPDNALLAEDRILPLSRNDRKRAPIAFVSRMDPWRKGLDRLCAWLSEYGPLLPRPAVLLLVPHAANEPPQLLDLVKAGLIEWDSESRGVALRHQLERCRGAMLLSRFDAQPRSLREALWLGLPILCTPECGFDEVLEKLASGRVVHGDTPSEIQAAYESLPEQTVDTDDVHHLLDRMETGRFLMSVLLAFARGEQPLRSYCEFRAVPSPGRGLSTVSD
jgi:glycosyltransferase involved in cell wall biosynthesis